MGTRLLLDTDEPTWGPTHHTLLSGRGYASTLALLPLPVSPPSALSPQVPPRVLPEWASQAENQSLRCMGVGTPFRTAPTPRGRWRVRMNHL